MISPRRAATFVAWGNAFLAGAADPDTASDAVRGRDLAHLVHGLPGRRRRRRCRSPCRFCAVTARPASGSSSRFPGTSMACPGRPSSTPPPSLRERQSSSAACRSGMVPSLRDVGDGPAARIAVDWAVLPVEPRPSPLPSLSEADRSLAASVA